MKTWVRWTSAAALALPAAAQAEIGIVGAPGSVYVSVESGYQHTNAPGVAAQGLTTAGPGNGASTSNGSFTSSFSKGSESRSAGAGSNNSAGSAASAFGAAQTMVGAGLGPSGTSGAATASGDSAEAAAIATTSGSASAAQATGGNANAVAASSDPFTTFQAGSDYGSLIRARDGAFGNVSVGYILPMPALAVTRIEFYATGASAFQNTPISGGFGFRGVDNASAFAISATPYGSLNGNVSQRVDLGEIGLRFKADSRIGPVFVAISGEPFYFDIRQRTTSSAGLPQNSVSSGFVVANGFGQRFSNVHGQLFGAQIALEGAWPVFDRISLLGRGSVGVYGMHASGSFGSSSFIDGGPFVGNALVVGATNDSQSRVGIRTGGQVGMRYEINPGAWFSVLAGLDYLSTVPTAMLPRTPGERSAYIGSRDLVDFRIGARLTLAAFAGL